LIHLICEYSDNRYVLTIIWANVLEDAFHRPVSQIHMIWD